MDVSASTNLGTIYSKDDDVEKAVAASYGPPHAEPTTSVAACHSETGFDVT